MSNGQGDYIGPLWLNWGPTIAINDYEWLSSHKNQQYEKFSSKSTITAEYFGNF